jgi:integration host factor subunit alpha
MIDGDIAMSTSKRKPTRTVTREKLYEAVYRKCGQTRTETVRLVEMVLNEIVECLERHEMVKLSAFGAFVVRQKGERVGRNPKNGKIAPIPPRRVVVFKASAVLKKRIQPVKRDVAKPKSPADH